MKSSPTVSAALALGLVSWTLDSSFAHTVQPIEATKIETLHINGNTAFAWCVDDDVLMVASREAIVVATLSADALSSRTIPEGIEGPHIQCRAKPFVAMAYALNPSEIVVADDRGFTKSLPTSTAFDQRPRLGPMLGAATFNLEGALKAQILTDPLAGNPAVDCLAPLRPSFLFASVVSRDLFATIGDKLVSVGNDSAGCPMKKTFQLPKKSEIASAAQISGTVVACVQDAELRRPGSASLLFFNNDRTPFARINGISYCEPAPASNVAVVYQTQHERVAPVYKPAGKVVPNVADRVTVFVTEKGLKSRMVARLEGVDEGAVETKISASGKYFAIRIKEVGDKVNQKSTIHVLKISNLFNKGN